MSPEEGPRTRHPLPEGASVGYPLVIYKDADFKGKRLRLDGPARHKNLKALPGSDQDWGDKIGSIETGPHARLTVYDDEDFGGDHIDTYGPNTGKVKSKLLESE